MNNARQTAKITVLYERLSRDDLTQNESLSIANQKQILETYAKQNGYEPFLHLTDDGWSGVRWDRPGWQKLIEMAERDEVGTILVKTMDRMGRDYLRMGLYRELFASKKIRLIAVTEGFDSFASEDDFTPFKEIMAEFYARDTSKKIKAVLHNKGHSGKPLTNQAIYGYRKDPADHNHWLVDEAAAPVVKRIFQMTIEGKGPYQIAKILHDEKIIRPSCHIARLNNCVTEKSETNPYNWTDATITSIIRKSEYCGNTVNFRTYKASFKMKKGKLNPPEKWEIFENTHESIIDSQTWETAQKCRTVKRRKNKSGEANPLTGLVYCGTCGSRMYNHRGTNYSETRPSQDSYCCTKYSKYPPECTRHNISVKNLRELILKSIQQVSGYVREHEVEFIEKLRADSEIKQIDTVKAQKKQLAADKKRVSELDRLIQQIYEDKVAGTLIEKRFVALSKQYETEQEMLEVRVAETERELAVFAEDGAKADKFIKLVRKYTSFEELTPTMLHEYIDKVVVHEAERSRGQRNQQIDIYLTYIGKFELPNSRPASADAIVSGDSPPPEDKRKEYQRDYYQRNKEKILAECAERYAAKKESKPDPPVKSAEEIAAEEEERKERRRAYQREYQREWKKKRKAEQSAAT